MTKNKKAELFTQGLEALQAYHKEHGHANVPATYRAPEGFYLGAWVNNTRQRKSSLSKHLIGKINKLDFDWAPLQTALNIALSHLKAYKKQYGHCDVPFDYETQDGFRLGGWVAHKRTSKSKLPVELVDQLDRMGFIWNKHDLSWNAAFEEYAGYVRKHGHSQIPSDYLLKSGKGLLAWVVVQRNRLVKGTMKPYRRKRLESIGFVESFNDFAWGACYIELVRYKKEFGDTRTPIKYISREGTNLGAWVSHQRNLKKNNKLSKDRIARLEDIGFVWSVSERISGQGYCVDAAKAKPPKMDECYELLRIYAKEHGHANVPRTYKTPDGANLGGWVARMRHNKSALSKRAIGKINKLNFDWNPNETALETGIKHLKAYKRQHGHCDIHSRYVTEDGYRLGAWVIQKRTSKNTLPVELVERLDRLGFIWSVQDRIWEDSFAELKAYAQAHGNTDVPFQYITESGLKLGNWVVAQKTKMRDNSILPLRAKQLKRYISTEKCSDSLWDANYRSLIAYQKEFGDTCPYGKYITPDGVRLGAWVSSQRKNKKRDKLSADRISRLDDIGFVWSDAEHMERKSNLKAEVGINHLKAYKKQYGHCDVSRDYVALDGYRLGTWVAQKRTRKSKLSAELVERLDRMGFIWNKHDHSWNTFFDDLKTYINKYGDSQMPYDYLASSGKNLYDWVVFQRGIMKDGSIAPHRRERLESIGFV